MKHSTQGWECDLAQFFASVLSLENEAPVHQSYILKSISTLLAMHLIHLNSACL